MATNNSINMSIPPKFSAYLITDHANVTGDATSYHVVCDGVTCNTSGAYNPDTGDFTTPYAGFWLLGGTMYWEQMAVDNTKMNVKVTKNASQIYRQERNASGNNTYTTDNISWSVVLKLALADVIALHTEVDGHATKNISLNGSPSGFINWYGIYLGAA